MKRFHMLPVVLTALLMVFALSCTTLSEGMGGYEEAPGSGRVYRNHPYSNQQVIVVERDPFTGQVYQVSPFGYYGGSPWINAPLGYGYGYPGRGGYYRGGSVGNRPVPRPSAPARNSSPTTQRAKDIIRGN